MGTAQLRRLHTDSIPAERRKHPRIKAAIQVRFRIEGLPFPAQVQTADISIGGCYVETTFSLELGTRLNMVLWVDDEKLLTKGVVATSHPDFGSGIRFTEMSPEDQDRLRMFVNALPN